MEKYGFTIPAAKPYLISTRNAQLLSAVDALTAKQKQYNVLIEGPQGCGKSELVTQYAASRGRLLATIEVGQHSNPAGFFGKDVLDSRDGVSVTRFEPGLFTRAISTPNAVVHLQELNRPENDRTLNAIFSVLNTNERSVWVDGFGKIQVADGVTFFATLNEGFDFIGTMPLDSALKSRFATKIRLSGLPEAQEKSLLQQKCLVTDYQIEEIFATINPLRQNHQSPVYVSTRDLIMIADLVSVSVPVETAVKAVISVDENIEESIRLGRHFAGQENSALTENFIDIAETK